MTLIEVIIAISIMAIVATSAITLSIASVTSTTVGQRQQVAVAIASNAMEKASAHSLLVNSATGESSIYNGRQRADVTAAWDASASFAGVSATYPGWDTSATATSTADIAIDTDFPVNDPTPPTVLNGTQYRVRTLIGACFQPNAGGDCARLPGVPSAPTGTLAPPETDEYSQLIRVIVIVSWTAAGGCDAGGCTYQTTTLLDPHRDLKWKINV